MRAAVAILTVVAFASVPLWLRDPYLMNALITTGIFIIGAMSLNLLLGFTGQLSLGHIAFFGIGAYVSALTSLGFDVGLPFGIRIVHVPWPPIVGFVLAIVVAGLCGYLVGLLSFRVRGAYFVIVTISFAEVVRLVALNWVELTQGPLALTNIPSITVGLPGLGDLTLRTKLQNYYLVLSVAVVTYLLISRLVHSHFGRAMRGLMENETLAVSVGIDVTKTLTLAAVISAGIAGAAGSLYAHYIRIIDPEVFAFINTVTMVIMVITGGKGSLAGPVVGGMIFGLLPVFLRPIMAPEAQWIAYGGVLIVILFVLPRGIVPSLAQRFAKRRKRIEDTCPGCFCRTRCQGARVMTATALKVEKVAMHFGGLVALSDMNFAVGEGEIVSLIGPNGAGKTTAFNIVTGFLDPTHGAVSYRGTALNGLKPHQIADLGLIRTFQRTSVFPNDTVYDNLLVGLHRQGRVSLLEAILGLPRARSSQRRLRERASELVEWVGLERRAHDLAGSLSYGEQRLVGVALALAAEPSMLLLDEPVSGMNASETHTFVQLVRNIRDRGVTILLVEHDMPMVMSVSDRIVVLNYGRIIAEGSPDVIRNDPAVIEAYLGQGAKRA